jgi:hypothetical protein
MRNLIKKVLREQLNKKNVISEMASKADWCSKFRNDLEPTYEFCKAAEEYIKEELEDYVRPGKRKRANKVFGQFENAIVDYYEKNSESLKDKLIRIEQTSPIFVKGAKDIEEAGKLLSGNCTNYQTVVNQKLNEFNNKVKLYFLDDKMYSIENRLPTNYSALANLFTIFFKEKGAFDMVFDKDHDWKSIVKNWISHSFEPNKNPFKDIRPEDEIKSFPLSSLSFGELSDIYFKGSTTFNSENLKKSVMEVLAGVRKQGFSSEDKFENQYLKGKETYHRFAEDFGFVDMYAGVDFIYKGENLWVPVQVKTTITEPTYLISSLGCKSYVIAELNKKTGKFEISPFPKASNLPK